MENILQQLLPKVGEIIGERYRVERVLGEGGFGVVFAAVQENLNRTVAIKMLLPHALTDSMAVHRFQQEVDLARRLEHPNTVRIFDRGQTKKSLQYYAMEYVKGRTLGEVIHGEGPLTQDRVKRVAEQILMSLGEAHAVGFAHRDLKPGNIMITEVFGQKNFVKVLDFGISKNFGASGDTSVADPSTVGLIGTPYYMSPEQAAGDRNIDGRSDLYSLGLIMNEMLTGRKIYEGPSPLGVLMAQLDKTPVPIPPEVQHSSLGQIIMQATAKDPAQRFQSAQAMLEALKATQAAALALQGIPRAWPDSAGGVMPSTPMGAGAQPFAPPTGQPHTGQQPWSQPAHPSAQYSGSVNPSTGQQAQGPVSGHMTGPSAAPNAPPSGPQGAGWSPQAHTANRAPQTQTGTHPKGVSTGLIIALLVVVVAAAAAAVIIVPKLGEDDEPLHTEADSGSPDETDVVEHEPVSNATLVAEAGDLIEQGRWEEALVRLDQIPEGDASFDLAERQKRVADAGLAHRSIYESLVAADRRGDYEAAGTFLDELPVGSFYLRQAAEAGINQRVVAWNQQQLVQQDDGPDAGNESDAERESDVEVAVADTGPDVQESADTAGPAAPVVIRLEGRPRRARVRLDGEVIGRVPCDIELPPGDGPVTLRVSATDHCSRDVVVERTHGETFRVSLREGCYRSIIP